jgi:hypothetical protein
MPRIKKIPAPIKDVTQGIRIPGAIVALLDWYITESGLPTRNAAVVDILERFFGNDSAAVPTAMLVVVEKKVAAIDPTRTLRAILSDASDEAVVDTVLLDVRATLVETVHNLRQLTRSIEPEEIAATKPMYEAERVQEGEAILSSVIARASSAFQKLQPFERGALADLAEVNPNSAFGMLTRLLKRAASDAIAAHRSARTEAQQ